MTYGRIIDSISASPLSFEKFLLWNLHKKKSKEKIKQLAPSVHNVAYLSQAP